MLRIDVITIFPGLFEAFLRESMVGIAIRENLIGVAVHDLREHLLGRVLFAPLPLCTARPLTLLTRSPPKK